MWLLTVVATASALWLGFQLGNWTAAFRSARDTYRVQRGRTRGRR